MPHQKSIASENVFRRVYFGYSHIPTVYRPGSPFSGVIPGKRGGQRPLVSTYFAKHPHPPSEGKTAELDHSLFSQTHTSQIF